MGESVTRYRLADVEDEDYTADLVFVHRSCMCMSPGCVDDEIRIFEGEEPTGMTIQIPRDMTPYLEGLFNGEYKLISDED